MSFFCFTPFSQFSYFFTYFCTFCFYIFMLLFNCHPSFDSDWRCCQNVVSCHLCLLLENIIIVVIIYHYYYPQNLGSPNSDAACCRFCSIYSSVLLWPIIFLLIIMISVKWHYHQNIIITHRIFSAGSHRLKLITWYKTGWWLSDDIHCPIWYLSSDFILKE